VEAAPEPRTALAPRARPWLAILGAAGLLLLVGVLLLTSLTGDEGSDDGNRRERRGAAGGAPVEGEDDAEAEAPPAEVPDLATHEDPEAGYQVSYPEEWSVVPQSDSITDFRDPETGAYLRMDWVAEPGDDAAEAWEAASDRFAARYDEYVEVRVDATEFQGFEAAEWEYTYVDDGAALHAVNIGIVTDTYGYAINFQTREEDWEESQALLEAIKESFVPGEGAG
jgi:hypothetical protein